MAVQILTATNDYLEDDFTSALLEVEAMLAYRAEVALSQPRNSASRDYWIEFE